MRGADRAAPASAVPAASAAPAANAVPAASAAPAAAAASSPAGVGARSAAVENAANGRLLWSRGLNTERPMASITKVMTALRRDQGGTPGPDNHRPVRRGRAT